MLLQNLFLESQAPLWEPGTEMVREWGEEGAEFLAVVLHRWIFQALRYPPQILPPFSQSQQPGAGTGRMGKKKKKEMKPLPTTPGMIYAFGG